MNPTPHPTPAPALPTADILQAAAAALRTARAQRRPIERISTTFGLAGLDAAYAVAEINTQAALAAGRRVLGKKVGLTSRAVQQQLGVDQPDFGVLLDDMEFLDGDAVPMRRLTQPKVEAEVAFVVGRDLAGDAPSWGEFLASLAYALPALEIDLPGAIKQGAKNFLECGGHDAYFGAPADASAEEGERLFEILADAAVLQLQARP